MGLTHLRTLFHYMCLGCCDTSQKVKIDNKQVGLIHLFFFYYDNVSKGVAGSNEPAENSQLSAAASVNFIPLDRV